MIDEKVPPALKQVAADLVAAAEVLRQVTDGRVDTRHMGASGASIQVEVAKMIQAERHRDLEDLNHGA